MKVINLKQKRKEKARSEKEKNALANRRKFGQTKEERQLEKLRAEKAKHHIEGHKLETGEEI
jgi:hypothetical protein